MAEIRMVGNICYELTRKKVKNINLKIRSDGSVAVSASARVPLKTIEEFLLSKQDFIQKHQDNFAKECKIAQHQYLEGEEFYYLGVKYPLKIYQGDQTKVELQPEGLVLTLADSTNQGARQRAIEQFFSEKRQEILTGHIKNIHPLFQEYGVDMPQFHVKQMKSRWGSCSPHRNVIALNAALIHVPSHCIRYLILHEYAHFIHQNHSQAFHDLVGKFMPEHRAVRRELKSYGFLL